MLRFRLMSSRILISHVKAYNALITKWELLLHGHCLGEEELSHHGLDKGPIVVNAEFSMFT